MVTRLSLTAAGLSLLLGCSDIVGGSGQSAEEGSTVAKTTTFGRADQNLTEDLLEKAIKVGDDLYMLPKGIDDEGCEMFGPFSENNATVTALQYRQADGSFNIAKDPAVCGVEMVALGTDPEGCEMYRAQPVTSQLAPTEIVYYRDAEGRYVPHKQTTNCS